LPKVDNDCLQHKGTMSTKPVFEKIAKIQRSYVQLCGHTTFVILTPAHTMTIIDKITIFCNDVNKTRRWHVTISCQPDGRPSQPVRPWKSGRIHLADGSKVVVSELPYSTEFGRESRKLASGVRKYGKFDDGR